MKLGPVVCLIGIAIVNTGLTQNAVSWRTIEINGITYTLTVDAITPQLDPSQNLFYSGNRNNTNSIYLVTNAGTRISNANVEQSAIYACESFFNLSQTLSWPGECNFQITPSELVYYTGTDNLNNTVNLYFPSAFDEDYFNSHVWLGLSGLEGLHNYTRRKNCYQTLWESCGLTP